MTLAVRARPSGVDGLVGIVVVGLDVAVQVGRGQDPQMRLAGLGAGGEGVQDHEPGDGRSGAEEAAAGEIIGRGGSSLDSRLTAGCGRVCHRRARRARGRLRTFPRA